MAIKTFTAGAVLTAADTNTYLANSGLVYVTSATVGTGVASVTVSSAFSSTYDAYQIVYSGGSISTETAIGIQIGSATTGYYGNYVYGNYATSAVTAASDNNASKFTYIGGGDTFNGCGAICTINNPFLSKQTYISSPLVTYLNFNGTYVGRLANSTSYTSFIVSPFAGTITGGTITVYGYRKA